MFFFFKQKTAYDMRISDWSSDVCSSDLQPELAAQPAGQPGDDQPVRLVQVIPEVRVGQPRAVVLLDPLHAERRQVGSRPQAGLVAQHLVGDRRYLEGDARLGVAAGPADDRSEEIRVGNGGGSTWRLR